MVDWCWQCSCTSWRTLQYAGGRCAQWVYVLRKLQRAPSTAPGAQTSAQSVTRLLQREMTSAWPAALQVSTLQFVGFLTGACKC